MSSNDSPDYLSQFFPDLPREEQEIIPYFLSYIELAKVEHAHLKSVFTTKERDTFIINVGSEGEQSGDLFAKHPDARLLVSNIFDILPKILHARGHQDWHSCLVPKVYASSEFWITCLILYRGDGEPVEALNSATASNRNIKLEYNPEYLQLRSMQIRDSSILAPVFMACQPCLERHGIKISCMVYGMEPRVNLMSDTAPIATPDQMRDLGRNFRGVMALIYGREWNEINHTTRSGLAVDLAMDRADRRVTATRCFELGPM